MFKLDTVENMRADVRRGCLDSTVDGICSSCGACCSNTLPISTKEVKTIERYIRKHGIKAQKKILASLQKSYRFNLSFPF